MSKNAEAFFSRLTSRLVRFVAPKSVKEYPGKTGLGGFEPPTSGLEARRYVQAKPQAQSDANNIRALG
jgi:hypothetical protein